MSKYLKSFTLSAALVLTLSTGVVVANSDILQNYATQSDSEIQSELKKISNGELLNEVNNLSEKIEPSSDINALIPFAAELLDRKDEISNKEILSSIKDSENTTITRNTMIELYHVKNNNDDNNKNELKELLKDKSFDRNVKVKIIATSDFKEEDIPLLQSIVLEDEDQLAFQAMKKLRKLDKEMAFQISGEILSKYKIHSEDKISSALKATSYYIKNSNNKVTLSNNSYESDFVNLSLDIMNSDKYSSTLKDSAFFATSDLRSENAILTILSQDNIDQELIVYAIGQNFFVLNDILNSNPTENQITLVIKAMEINPLTDLYDSLNKIVPTIQNNDLRKRGEQSLVNIKENGEKANHKWLDNAGGEK
jgi:hypothetical protein